MASKNKELASILPVVGIIAGIMLLKRSKKTNASTAGIGGYIKDITPEAIDSYRKSRNLKPERFNDRYEVIVGIHYPEGIMLVTQMWTEDQIKEKYRYYDGLLYEFIEYA